MAEFCIDVNLWSENSSFQNMFIKWCRTQTQILYLYETERRGKRARQQRDWEKECLREGGWLKEEVESVVKMTVGENGPFRIRIGLKWQDYFNCSKPF